MKESPPLFESVPSTVEQHLPLGSSSQRLIQFKEVVLLFKEAIASKDNDSKFMNKDYSQAFILMENICKEQLPTRLFCIKEMQH